MSPTKHLIAQEGRCAGLLREFLKALTLNDEDEDARVYLGESRKSPNGSDEEDERSSSFDSSLGVVEAVPLRRLIITMIVEQGCLLSMDCHCHSHCRCGCVLCVWRLCVLMIGDENVALISAIAKKEPAMQRSSAFF